MSSRLATVPRILAIPVVAGASLLPGLPAGPSLDAGVFTLLGWQMTLGDVLYVDAWDHKPPGIHLAHALANALPGDAPWTWVWLLTLAVTVATSVTVVRILAGHVTGAVAALAGIACALGLGHFLLALGGGMSESFAVLPATLALRLSVGGGTSRRRSLLAGVLIGTAVVTSPQLAPAAVACAVALGARSGAALIPYLCGSVVPILVLLGALAGVAGLPAFVDAVLVYNSAYRQAAGPGFALLPWVTLTLIFLVAPALASGFAVRRAGSSTRLLVVTCAAWLVVSAVLIAGQGRLYGHYVLATVVPLSVLAAVGMDDALGRLRATGARLTAYAALTGLLVLSLLVGAAGARMELAMIEPINARASALAEWIAGRQLEGRRILVWGNAPQAYRLSGTPPSLRYGFLYPLTTPGYASDARIREAVADLESAPPALVVDAGSLAPGEPGFLPLLVDRRVATDGRDLDLLDPLRDFVSDRYELVEVVHGWPVYRLRPDTSRDSAGS